MAKLNANKNLLELEAEAESFYLSVDKALFYDLPEAVLLYMGDALASRGLSTLMETPISDIVCRQILVRLMQDLRSTYLLAVKGYPAAAATVTSSILEMAYEIPYIGNDDIRTQKWIDHRDIRRTNETYFNRMSYVLSKIELTDLEKRDILEQERQTYQILSAAKHGNSMFQQLIGIESGKDSHIITSNPSKADFSVRTSAYSIYHACRLGLRGAIGYLDAHATDVDDETWRKRAEKILGELKVSATKILGEDSK